MARSKPLSRERPAHGTQEIAEITRATYRAYETGDRAALETLLADDFEFSSPHDPHLDRAGYFERCWPNHENIERITIEKLFVQDNEAFVRYEITDSGSTWRNAELLGFEDGKLRRVEVYYGSTA